MALRMDRAKIVVIDGDDTLWADRVHFRKLYKIAQGIIDKPQALREAIATGGPGEVGFVRAIVELADTFDLDDVTQSRLRQAIEEFKAHPVTVFLGVEPALVSLIQGGRDIVLYSKGVYAEQASKIERSGLGGLFSRVFIVEEKNEGILREVIAQCGCRASSVLVVGNSIKDDIAPACAIGAQCIWFNHSDNAHGRDGEAIPGVIEISSWNDFTKLLDPS